MALQTVCHQTVSNSLPVGVIQAGVALSGQCANLLPVSDKLVFLQMDLGGILGMCLLKALCITTKCVDLIEREKTGDKIRAQNTKFLTY